MQPIDDVDDQVPVDEARSTAREINIDVLGARTPSRCCEARPGDRPQKRRGAARRRAGLFRRPLKEGGEGSCRLGPDAIRTDRVPSRRDAPVLGRAGGSARRGRPDERRERRGRKLPIALRWAGTLSGGSCRGFGGPGGREGRKRKVMVAVRTVRPVVGVWAGRCPDQAKIKKY